MSHRTLDIAFGVTGQSLFFDAPEGRPSSVTSSSIFENSTGDDGTAESATTGSAAVETNPSTTFDAASGAAQANPTKCNLTATTGIAPDRVFLATNALGQKEFVEVTAFASADYALVREPLQFDYTTADTFVSTRITHAIDATWVAASSNLSDEFDPNPRYRWRLVYVVSSVTYVHDVYFDLLRYPSRHDVRPTDVNHRAPGWTERAASYYRDGRIAIDEAHQVVKFDLYNLSTPDQSIRNREVVNELVKLKAIELVDQTELNAKHYNDRFMQLLANGKTVTSKSSSGAASPGDVVSKWSK
jgi:hypothetical protein